jgi:hypothetical protein
VEERSNWVEQHGSADIADNVRCALAMLDETWSSSETESQSFQPLAGHVLEQVGAGQIDVAA